MVGLALQGGAGKRGGRVAERRLHRPKKDRPQQADMKGRAGMSSRDFDGRLHPKAKEALELMERGRMSRRSFIRVAALVGVSAAAAYAMAGLPQPAFAQEGTIPFKDDPNAKKGGIL